MIEAAIQYWRGLAARERRLVGAAAVTVALAVVYLALFEPAWEGRRKLGAEIPVLRAQLAQVTALGDEARKLGAMPATAGSIEALRSSLEQSVKAAGMAPKLAAFEVSGELFELRFKDVLHAPWLEWLDTTLRETRLRVATVSVTREAAPGVVSVRLVLEAPPREGR
ncbi:MAG TPA: type II secretion system protein GspM [Quisquiliibacterium sp.]|nr:type II secretion system protein GspM [Quisquiliibacterium sp.]